MSLIETKQWFAITLPPYMNGKPYINQNAYSSLVSIYDARNNDIRKLMDWVKRCPEALGIVNKLSCDVATSVSFKAIEKKSVRGRPSKDNESNAEEKARIFALNNFFRQIVKESITDAVITGDFYNYKAKIPESQMKEIYLKTCEEKGIKPSYVEMKDFLDEDVHEINAIQYVPSTTIVTTFDHRNITGYVQRVDQTLGAMNPNVWRPNQVIHGTFMKLDGKVNGYSPMTALKPVISTLGLIKDYAGNYFSGGGAPDMVFAFEQNLDPNTKEQIRQDLENYKNNLKRGHMLVDGAKLSIDKINEFNKDMEFYKLAIYYTGILAFAFRMPTSAMGPIIGSIIKQSTGGIDSTEGDYWRNIRGFQEYLEDLYNTQLWIPEFDVEMRFDKPYLIDEIKESQNKMFINDGLAKTNFMLGKYGKQLKIKTILSLLGFEDEDIEEMSEEQKLQLAGQSFGSQFTPGGNSPPGNRQNMQDNKSLSSGQATENYRNAKRAQAKKPIGKELTEEEIGFEEEKSEHPELSDEIIKQLVSDHLKKNPFYYSKGENAD